MSRIFDELKRRNVFRVAGVYAVVGWLLAQAAGVLENALNMPGWFDTVVVSLLLLGFPVALVLAWAFELTPEGVKLTANVAEAESIAGKTGRKLDYAILGGVALIALMFIADRLAPSFKTPPPAAPQDESANLAPHPDELSAPAESVANNARNAPAAAEKSVAVLPFLALSSGEDDGYFADGLTEEILNSLAALPGLLVTARTSSFYFKGKDVPIVEIAETLGVAHVVEGSVRRAGDKIRVTAQLIRAKDGFHLWSQTYDRPLNDVFEVQTDIAEKIAGVLSIYLDDAHREAIAASGTRNVEAFKSFLKGKALYLKAHAGEAGVSLWDANEEFERALALDPDYVAPAVEHHDAYAHYLMDGPDGAFVKGSGRRGPVSEEEALDRLLADLDLAVKNAPTPTVRVVAELNKELFSRSWDRMPSLLKRLRDEGAIEEVSGFDVWLSNILLLNGEFDLARRLSDQKVRTNPLEPSIWSLRAGMFIALGDFDAAEDAIDRGRAMAGDHPWLRDDELFLAILRRDREKVVALLKRPEENRPSASWREAYLAAVEGDYDRATRLADEIEKADPWPVEELLRVYHETGDRSRARTLTRKIDALTVGPAVFARTVTVAENMLFFNLADAPNFSARLEEARIDRKIFRPMPRLSVEKK